MTVPQVKDSTITKHKGKTQYLKGMPAETGGYHVYEGQMAMLHAWLANRHFCPTELPALVSLQDV